ncbi:ankyrin repeat domain-containing protein [Solicola gregarius]|uniref:Ankyrin repeat domain-containing protein n=1 Tax=Solicola gregarius TaxID=2908642 RepID=A0AA46TEP9_9ACTN|nr:ankyrin repeat domain-containing protein [Solicola gregarius]UYM03437.1 ankyrin repeat domain-containing protein [Solicola gregarius]
MIRAIAVAAASLVLVAACAGQSENGEPAPASGGTRTARPTDRQEQPTRPQETTVLSDERQAELDSRLIEAAWDNHVSRVRRLIEDGADVNAKDDTEQSAYLVATSEGYDDLLDLTLRHGADVTSLDSFDGTGLIRAAERGHAGVVGRLIQADIDVNHVNNLGWTALHEAIVLGDGSGRYVDTVRTLVAGGADVRLPSAQDGVAPIDHATRKGYDAVAETLRAALDERPIARPDQALLDAAASGDADRAALAIRAGAELEVGDERGRTPLLVAVTNDRIDVARLLVALGADPDALDDQHDTPWLVTGVTGSVPMLEALLSADPDLSIRNRYGGLSAIPASERGHVEYVRRVVRTDIDINHVNDLGWTALLEAVILGDGSRPYQEIVRILLAAGADPAIADGDGVTALQHAESSGQDGVANVLRDAS